MKRWQYIAIAVAGLAGLGFFYLHHQAFGLDWLARAWASGNSNGDGTVHLTWLTVDRPDQGFRVDLPSEPKDLEVPAFNESGGTEPVKMIFASPDPETTFAVTWEDNPPVARVNNRLPERTLEMARDGMLARTQTSLVSDSRVSLRGYPGHDIAARNSGGGVLNARLIYVGERLYTLLALFSSDDARREQDVRHFFNSFLPARQGAVPEAVPPA